MRRPDDRRLRGARLQAQLVHRRRLDPRAQIAQHARQIVVAAEREDERGPARHRRPAGRDHRQPSAEADAHHSDLAIGREARVGPQPPGRLLDGVGDGWSDLEMRELRNVGRDDRKAAAGKLTRQTDEPRLIDAGRVQARDEQRRAMP